jgi:hypothetical protein
MLSFKRHGPERATPCAHTRALPRWDNVDDAGRMDRPYRLYCPACGSFLPQPAASAGQAGAADQHH